MRKLTAVVLMLISSIASAQLTLDDTGVWADERARFQGFVFMPVAQTAFVDEAIVLYWFTHTEDGEQVWFISDNIATNGSNLTPIEFYEPIGFFASEAATVGPRIGVGDLQRQGDSFRLRFSLSDASSLGECRFPLPLPPTVSPTPPPLEDGACEGVFELRKVTPHVTVVNTSTD